MLVYMVDPLSCVPIKSNHNDTDVQGIQPVFKVRQPENAIGDPIERILRYQTLSQTEKDEHDLVWACDRKAAELCNKGRNLYGMARYRWISGQTGVLLSKVQYFLRQ